MSDEISSQKNFGIQKVYVKDISFETPHSPQVFLDKWEPEVSLQVGNNAQTLTQELHEITLTLTVTAKLGEKIAYLAEIKQAGIFNIDGFANEELGLMLGAYCPNVLFPFAREAVADLVARGGFPQLLLAPINFDALYAQHIQQQRAAQTGGEAVIAH